MTSAEAIASMLNKQIQLNSSVSGSDWHDKPFKWHTAIWIECAELMETIDWKWWKKTGLQPEQFLSELIDIWHFGMTMLALESTVTSAEEVEALSTYIDNIWHSLTVSEAIPTHKSLYLHTHIERIAMSALIGTFNLRAFFDTMKVAGIDIDTLYTHYTAKHILNNFRVDHGYKTGEYKWNSKQDNLELQALVLHWELGVLAEYPETFESWLKSQLEYRYLVSTGYK